MPRVRRGSEISRESGDEASFNEDDEISDQESISSAEDYNSDEMDAESGDEDDQDNMCALCLSFLKKKIRLLSHDPSPQPPASFKIHLISN
jgi:hypothetical protein